MNAMFLIYMYSRLFMVSLETQSQLPEHHLAIPRNKSVNGADCLLTERLVQIIVHTGCVPVLSD